MRRKMGRRPRAAGPVCHAVGTHLERVVRPHCAGAPAALWHVARAAVGLLLLRSEVRALLHSVRPVIAAAALLQQHADCGLAATPRTRKCLGFECQFAALRSATGTSLQALCVRRFFWESLDAAKIHNFAQRHFLDAPDGLTS
jgi:hypothetical protein